MKTWNIRIIAAGSLLVILAIAMAAGAQQGKQARAANTAGIAQNLGIQEFLRGLRLTETQREAIKIMLQSHRAEILDTREALLQARLSLVKESPNGSVAFVEAQTKLMDLRLRIFNEIKTKLTADQLAVLKERQERQAERLERMLERLRDRGAN